MSRSGRAVVRTGCRPPSRPVAIAAVQALAMLVAACAVPIRDDPAQPGEYLTPAVLVPSGIQLDSRAGAYDGAMEIGADARLTWRMVSDTTLSLALDAGGIRGRESWSGLLASGRWIASSAARPWIELGAGLGTGIGAAKTLRLAAGVEDRHLAFAMRAVRWEESGPLEIIGPPPFGARHARVWQDYVDGEVTGRFEAGTLHFELLGGLRLSDLASERPWASAGVAFPLSHRWELRLAGGLRPDRPERGERAGSFARIGIAVRPLSQPPAAMPLPPGPGRLDASPLDDGAWTIAIRAPAARTVEINGDMTRWSPLRLRRSPDDAARWTARLDVDAGVYLVALRIDGGEWQPPPGLPVVPDGFGGQAGLLELIERKSTPTQEGRQ